MTKLEKTGLIEYQGDFYTPDEFVKLMKDKGTYEIVERDGETWFSKAMATLENKQ